MDNRPIIHVSTALSWRGGEQQIAYLWRGLANRGVVQHLMARKGGALAAFAKAEGWSLTEFDYRGAVSLATAWKLHRLARKLNALIVHAHDSHAHTAAWLARTSAPVIVHRRVDFPVFGWLSLKKYNSFHIPKIICVSKGVRDVLRPAIQDERRLAVVYSGIDCARFEVPVKDLRRELSLPPGSLLIGKVAALADHKDYPTFIRTAQRLIEREVNAHFLLIGRDDGEWTAIEAAIKATGFADRFHWLGHLDDIDQVLPGLDLFLFTSKTEGLGTSILDAFAARVPVIATAAGGIPELVIPHRTGMLAPVGATETLAEAVITLLADDVLRSAIIEEAAAYVQTFGYQRMADSVLDIYRTVAPTGFDEVAAL